MKFSVEEILTTITALAGQIQKEKIRAMEQFFEAGSEDKRDEAQRAIGAERALEELRRRLRCLDPATPAWIKPALASQDADLLFRRQSPKEGSALRFSSTRFHRRGA